MLQRTYDRVMGLAAHRHAIWWLAAISFIESSVFPIPPDVLLIPMVLAARTQAWRIAAVCTVASVLGGLAGYGIGAFLFEALGRPLLEFYGYAGKFESFRAQYNEWGAWIVAGAGITPFPYKVITIASVLSRGARFFMVAALLWWIGPPVRVFIERHLALLTTAFFALLFGGFIVLKYVM